MNSKEEIAQIRKRMEKAIDDIRKELASIRTGRASISILDNINVEYYGVPTPINEVRQECLVDMIFNLGEDGVRKFRDMVAEIMDKDPDDWTEIAQHATASLWYGQVGGRAERIVKELASGEREVT